MSPDAESMYPCNMFTTASCREDNNKIYAQLQDKNFQHKELFMFLATDLIFLLNGFSTIITLLPY